MTTPPKFCSTDLLILERQLTEWRQAQSGRFRLPGEVWEVAAVLAHRHGPSRVARTLGLSYPKLRQWMSRPGPERSVGPAPTAGFVELKWSSPTDAPLGPLGWAELRDASGRVLRLHTGRDPQAWLALADSFWRQGR
jgi:hypothetical protein